MIPIIEDGTAFQFKTKSVHAMGAWGSQNEVQVIGRVDDKDKGDCTCFIYSTETAMRCPRPISPDPASSAVFAKGELPFQAFPTQSSVFLPHRLVGLSFLFLSPSPPPHPLVSTSKRCRCQQFHF